MGYYINYDSKGRHLGLSTKADNLIADGAVEVSGDKFQPDLVCVVDVNAWEAALYCYSEKEYQMAADPSDIRPKRWLIVKNAAELSGFTKKTE